MSKTNEKLKREIPAANDADETTKNNIGSSGKKSSGRGRSRGRGRRTKSTPRKNSQKKEITDPDEEKRMPDEEKMSEEISKTTSSAGVREGCTNLNENEFDIDSLPSFISTSTSAFNSESQIWNNRVNLIGQKCSNLIIHICDKCSQPILIYGRLIPCKHAFCLNCSSQHEGNCFCCNERIISMEKCTLATLFMCSNENCKRTYLSERDLFAHINHRHTSKRSLNSVTAGLNQAMAISARNAFDLKSSQLSSTLHKLVKHIGSLSNTARNSNLNTFKAAAAAAVATSSSLLSSSSSLTTSASSLSSSNRMQFNSPRMNNSHSSTYALDNYSGSSSATLAQRPYGQN